MSRSRSLDALGVPYYLAGSVISSLHGIACATADVDIVAAPHPIHTAAFANRLADEYYADADVIVDGCRSSGTASIGAISSLWPRPALGLRQSDSHDSCVRALAADWRVVDLRRLDLLEVGRRAGPSRAWSSRRRAPEGRCSPSGWDCTAIHRLTKVRILERGFPFQRLIRFLNDQVSAEVAFTTSYREDPECPAC
jgi:hypothetical protein